MRSRSSVIRSPWCSAPWLNNRLPRSPERQRPWCLRRPLFQFGMVYIYPLRYVCHLCNGYVPVRACLHDEQGRGGKKGWCEASSLKCTADERSELACKRVQHVAIRKIYHRTAVATATGHVGNWIGYIKLRLLFLWQSYSAKGQNVWLKKIERRGPLTHISNAPGGSETSPSQLQDSSRCLF